MRWRGFSRFDFNDPDNVYLYREQRGPLFWILVVGLTFIGLLWFIDWAMNPNWSPHYYSGRKGIWIISLLAALPLPVRAAVFVLALALVAEAFCRGYYRMYDGRSAFVIGPSGVAWIDPWKPCAIGWDEVREIRRETSEKSWVVKKPTTLELAFLAAPSAPPRYVPSWLWEMLPARLTGRRIEVNPAVFGRNEDQLIWLIRHFAGPITIVDHELGLD